MSSFNLADSYDIYKLNTNHFVNSLSTMSIKHGYRFPEKFTPVIAGMTTTTRTSDSESARTSSKSSRYCLKARKH